MAQTTHAPARIGPYELERELGTGGMGTVYLARERGDERRVALKLLHPELVAACRELGV